MSILRFGIIGLGSIAEIHAKSIMEISNAELYAICTTNVDKADEFKCKYDIKKIYRDIEDLILDDQVDVVCILTPSGLHGDMGIKVAKAGKHVIVEKPIDITLENADKLIKTCNENNVKLGVISQHRMDKSTIAVKKAIEDKKFGKLLLGNAHIKWFRSKEYYDSGKWRGTWELDGGGVLMNQGIHTIDLLLHIMGDVKSVYAICKTMDHKDIEVEDVATAILEFKNGALGTIVGSTAVYPGLPARLEINGTAGSATIEGDELVLYNIKGEKTWEDTGDNIENITGASNPMDINNISHRLQLKNIVESILDNRQIECDGIEGRRAIQVILAIYKSQREKKVVYIDDESDKIMEPYNEISSDIKLI